MTRRTAVPCFLLLCAMACGGAKSADTGKAPLNAAGSAAKPQPVMTPDAQATLEAGNAAFRKKDYATALTEFEKAAKLSPDHAAPWFGIYMVAQARKDDRAADAALTEIRKRSDSTAVAAPALAPTLDSDAMRRAHAKAGVGAVKN